MLCLFCPLPPSFFAAVLQTCYELYSRHSHPLGCSQLAHSHGCTFFGGGDGIPLNGSEGPKLLSRLAYYIHALALLSSPLVAFGGEEVLKNISHLCNTCTRRQQWHTSIELSMLELPAVIGVMVSCLWDLNPTPLTIMGWGKVRLRMGDRSRRFTLRQHN